MLYKIKVVICETIVFQHITLILQNSSTKKKILGNKKYDEKLYFGFDFLNHDTKVYICGNMFLRMSKEKKPFNLPYFESKHGVICIT